MAWLAVGAMLVSYRGDLPAEALLLQEPPGRASPPSTARRGPRDQLPSSQDGFDRLWAGHPHHAEASERIRREHGLPDYMANTCAIRLSIMLNTNRLTITPEKTKAAGIARRPYYSSKTRQYYILSAREMWTYLARYFRAADRRFPAAGKYSTPGEFQQQFDSAIKPIISQRKGIVAFEKLFSYDGTGHVDLFDGELLSDSITWYPCTRLHVWYVIVP